MHTNAERTMRDELEQALGEPISAQEAQEALARPAPTLAHWVREQQLLIAITVAMALVVGAIVSIALGSWIFTVLALVIHGVATVVVGYVVLRVTSEVDKPGPVTVARLQAEGIDDPESKLNRAIQAHEGAEGDRVRREFEVDAEDANSSAAKQQVSITPSSEETDLVGPGQNGKRE